MTPELGTGLLSKEPMASPEIKIIRLIRYCIIITRLLYKDVEEGEGELLVPASLIG